MLDVWSDFLMGGAWGAWLAFYLERLYARQVTFINLSVFVLWGRSYKANWRLAKVLNVVLLSVFLFAASAVMGMWVVHWGYFILGWCLAHGVYALARLSASRHKIQHQHQHQHQQEQERHDKTRFHRRHKAHK